MTELGIDIEVSPVQFWKALLPIEVTELDRVREVIDDSPLNIMLGICLTLSPNIICVR